MTTTILSPKTEDLTGHYEIDAAHSRLGFVVRYAMVTNVRGQFREFGGSLRLDAQNPSNSVAEVRIHVSSIDTGQAQRDAHLCSPEFFDADRYPEIVFRTTDVRRHGDQAYRLAGDLAIKDVTRPITIALTYAGSARDPFGNVRAGFVGSAEIDRKDWGLTWNAPLETGGVLIGEQIGLELDVSAIKLPT